MRQKAYYTKDEIITNLYTTGSEWMTESEVEYRGLYHTYITGETYTQGTWNPKTSVKLLPFEQTEPNAKLYKQLTNLQFKYNTVRPHIPQITQQDRETGFVARYFIKKINENNITEIDKTQYQDWLNNKIDRNLYSATEIFWRITGNRNNEYQNTVLQLGVIETNTRSIQIAQQTLPGITLKLTNPLEYYSDVDISVPADINP